VAAAHKHEVVCPHHQGTAAAPRPRLRGLLDLRTVGPQQLLQVGDERRLPCNPEHLAFRRNIFPQHGAAGSGDLVKLVALRDGLPNCAAQVLLVQNHR
jgi:hypothetical protein